MSGKQRLESGMSYRKEQVHMGLPGIREFDIYRTDENQIRRARQVIDEKLRAGS